MLRFRPPALLPSLLLLLPPPGFPLPPPSRPPFRSPPPSPETLPTAYRVELTLGPPLYHEDLTEHIALSHTLDLPLAAEAFVEAHPSIFGDELSPTDAAYSFQQTILLPDWLHAQPVPYGKERGRTERAKIENLTNIVASVDLPVEGTPGLVLEVADSIVVPGERGLFL